jgi:ribosomal protein S12 methylthiotransferase accessory factor
VPRVRSRAQPPDDEDLGMNAPADIVHELPLGRGSLIEDIVRVTARAGDPRVHLAVARVAAVDRYAHVSCPSSGGAGFTPEQAVRAMIGECLERYASTLYREADLVAATADELGDAAVGFDRFEHYAASQLQKPNFPLARFGRDEVVHWVNGRSLLDGGRRYVPACLVYLGYPEAADDYFSHPVSTGTACHRDELAATLAGLYEVIERDAFMITWLRRLQRTRIEPATTPVLKALLESTLAGTACRYHCFDISTDIAIPTVLCVLEARSTRGPLIAVGAATRCQEHDAVAKAMLEASSVLAQARELLASRPDWRPAPDYVNVIDFNDHVRLFCEPAMVEHARFLLDAPAGRSVAPCTPPQTSADELAACAAAVAAAGLEPIACDLTSADVAAAGYRCVKVLVPGAVPLVGPHTLPPLGSHRLDTVPRAVGAQPLCRFNDIPHPFA